jgi:hypothetical protein
LHFDILFDFLFRRNVIHSSAVFCYIEKVRKLNNVIKTNMKTSLLYKLNIVDPSVIPDLISMAADMGLKIRIVTLTGGPCAGKSDSLIHLEGAFIKRGYQVIVLPEAPTIIRNQGFRAEQGVYPNGVCQRMMILQNESFLINAIIAAIHSHIPGTVTNMLIIRDRNSIDCAAYVPSVASFEAMLSDMNISVAHICHSDVTVFLRSLAVDKSRLYKRFARDNRIRFETVDQAIEADERLLSIHAKYSHPHVVNNRFRSFKHKIKRVIEIILDALGEPKLEKELSFIVRGDAESILERLGISRDSFVDIHQFYTADGSRYRRITYPGGIHRSYIQAIKIDTDKPDTRIEIESHVMALEFVNASNHINKDSTPVDKRRYFSFIDNGYTCFILEVDVFASGLPRGYIRVEVEYGLRKPNISSLLDGLEYVDVTGRKDCSNRSIAFGTFPTDLFG